MVKKTERNPLIVIASNRGPYKFEQEEDGSFTSQRGAGGLVTALSALAEQLDVLWVAAALSDGDKAWAKAQGKHVKNVDGIDLRLVITDDEQYQQYYNQIANPLLWFIHHGLWDTPRHPMIDTDTWDAWENGYIGINKQFAESIVESVREEVEKQERPVLIFPQDYHLYLVPKYVREALGDAVQIQPFLHIPWPGPDSWNILPETMRHTLLESMLHADSQGFQTKRDAFNFVQTARFYLNDAHSYGARDAITYKERRVGAKAYPISVDVDKIDILSRDPLTQMHKREIINVIGDRKLILRVDRVEPSKNILRGIRAYRDLLEKYPEHRGKVQMLSLLVPSRMGVGEYQDYLGDLMAENGILNANFSDEFWEPSRIIVGNNYPRALAAMQLYDVLLVNPLADGMNLVAKEGTLINEKNGVLILSEHAGAFYELGKYSLPVSPFDVYSTAEAMHEALIMPEEDRKKRAEALAKIVRNAGVKEWFSNQVQDALKALNNQANKASTPGTPAVKTSAD